MAIPWLAAGTWGAYAFVTVLRHRGEWAIFGFVLGLPMAVGGLVVGALAFFRIRVGIGLWRRDRAIANTAERLAHATMVLDALAVLTILLIVRFLQLDVLHRDREALVVLLPYSVLTASVIAHAFALLKAARRLRSPET